MSHLEVKVINIYSCREVRVQQQGPGPAVHVPVIVHLAEVPSSLHRGSLHLISCLGSTKCGLVSHQACMACTHKTCYPLLGASLQATSF
jgi:hypothetical protein